MNSQPLPELTASDQNFARIWGESTGRVLEQLHGSPFAATPRSPAADAAPEDALWARFKVSGKLSGELAFQFKRSDGVRLAQLLMSEPMDASVAFNDTHVDAVGEVFRQFAGLASTACKSSFGGEVQFALESTAAGEWQAAGRAVWVFAAPKVDPIEWTLLLSGELHASLEAAQTAAPAIAAAEAAPVAAAEPEASGAKGTPEPGVPANLDLLLDVELDATLRFGQREMLLRDILELHPGSVVELNRRVHEPAELLVSGRVIAHGEVVIVDGNYGLRITDIAQPRQRLESLET